ncbi:MAG: SUF system Fe-S cluster assembly protein [Ignavibacteria bacterium]|jgi:FeS assembly SUF system protein|nr:SUF system Fe-S cluster assembly protein [Ignavibacteria bacterium]
MAETEPTADELDDRVVSVIKTCYDPEIPVNIYELGLIYQIRVQAHGVVAIKMTLTSPNCPAAQSLPEEVRNKVKGIPGVSDVKVDIVWDPPWTTERMTEAARLELGFF